MTTTTISSSSSSVTPQSKYDVFLSFRGKDTRKNFTSHLHAALCLNKIQTFIDYKLNRGDDISPSLLKAIEESQISVVVFSKEYASSGWCLEELVKILECKNMYGQLVIPVFYGVEPSHVRYQTGSFADAFKKHEQRFKDGSDKLQRWRFALTEAAKISGWDSTSSEIRPESVLVKGIVEDILKKLNDMSPSDNDGLVFRVHSTESSFLKVLFDRLASPQLWEFARRDGVHSKLEKCGEKLLMIEAVLNDAEEKQLTNTDVKSWLDNLQNLAYDVEDILDEFATEQDQDSTPKTTKIENVTSRLEALCKLRDCLGLKAIPGGTSSNAAARRPPRSTSAAGYQRSPNPSVPTKGRDDDKRKILEMVFNDDERRILEEDSKCIISIFGMAGIGKSTLAWEVYRDKKVGESFQLKVWACVSNDFDVLRISQEILAFITGKSCNLKGLNAVQNQLRQKVAGKKFLLVLDDVWSKNYNSWETLMSPFMDAAGGSKIIVTTRHSNVAKTIKRCAQCYELKLLSDEECWSLFKAHAFPNDDHPDIHLIREKVIQRSKLLPLASKTLGGLLGSKQIDEWLKILNNKMWDLVKESDIPATLKLSYYYLPSRLKRCFAHCAILEEDYEFEEEQLVFLWIAEGLIKRSDGDLGHEYFDDLLSRSIFQRSNSNESKYVMHDLFRELAKWVSGGTCSHLEDISEASKQPESFKKVRHLSYASGPYDGKCRFEVISEAKLVDHHRLRTFLPLPSYEFHKNFISPTVISDLLPKFKKLRTLSLENYHITELLEWLGDLRHLIFLNLSGTGIKNLPESISSLLNLQILKLKGCYLLEKLPSKMRNLINLQHLDIRGCYRLIEMPLGLNELKCTLYLSDFVVGKGVGAGLKDLKNFNLPCKELRILELKNAVDLHETREMILHYKDLKALQLNWGDRLDDEAREEAREESVLGMLRPHQNLQELAISRYGGIKFPSWVGDSSFYKMVTLTLECCESCTLLPSLGLLGSLKHLTIKGMKGLKSVGKEICGEHCSTPFQALETLHFDGLLQWERWEIEGNQYGGAFPSLKEFVINNCPKLSRRLPDRLPSLEKLEILRCKQLVISISSLPLLCKLKIDGCKGMVCNSPTDFQSLKFMTLANIDCLQVMNGSFFGKPPQGQGLQSFISITELSIENISNLVSFPEVCLLSNLSKLVIRYCNALTVIVRGQLPCSLKMLQIQFCDNLVYLWDDEDASLLEHLWVNVCRSLKRLSSSGHLPRMLRTLLLDSVPELESIEESFCNNKSLERIIIQSCHNLKSMPADLHNLNRLRRIWIIDCESMECLAEEEEGLANTNLSELIIVRCEKLKALPNRFHSLNSLKRLELKGCPSMSSLFPDEGFPTNLTSLVIDCEEVKIYKPLLEWGLHNLTSLTFLEIDGLPEAESFPQQEIEMRLPPSLTRLEISRFPNLKCLLAEGFRNLNSLESLVINDCPNLTSFPKQGLPSSLSQLSITNCPELRSFPKQGLPSSLSRLYILSCPKLEEECKRGKGKEWPKISNIPLVEIDGRNIYDP